MANSEELQRRLDEELPSFAADWEERAALAMEPFVYAMPSNWGKAWGERQKVMDKTVRTQDLVERAKRKAEKREAWKEKGGYWGNYFAYTADDARAVNGRGTRLDRHGQRTNQGQRARQSGGAHRRGGQGRSEYYNDRY